MKIKVIFVCLGNICRSPMAEAIFQDLIDQEDLSSRFIVNSAGTAHYHIGSPPDKRTIKTCEENKIKINHSGKQLKYEDLDQYDYVIAMDLQNIANIRKLAHTEQQLNKIYLLRDFSEPSQNLIVPDPYHGNIDDFKQVFNILSESNKALLEYIKKREIN